MSRQMSLFDSPEPAPEPKVVLSDDYVRKSLNRLLRMVRNADTLPWHEDDLAIKQRLFLNVSRQLPEQE